MLGYRPAGKLRARLGWVPCIVHPPGDKPEGMHRKTYLRLTNDYHHVSRALAGHRANRRQVAARLARNRRR